jgi:nicotinamide phosphoribosyltransferase
MISAILYKDFYKTGHIWQYPENTTKVYSNLTARISRIPGVEHVVVFGVRYFVDEYLVKRFNSTFFYQPKYAVIASYRRRMDTSLGAGAIKTEHLEALHDLGYLPIRVKALDEGTLCPLRIPMLTITNTHPDFAWLPNFLETLLSNALWHPTTSATIAYEYRKILEGYAALTSDMPEFVKWQGHDFSMRGQTSLESAMVSGAAHLTSFTGTDTIPAIDWLEEHYDANAERELIAGSVPATEHSVMCLGGKDTERETVLRLITEVYPKGIVSIVMDTWHFWEALDVHVRSLKDVIMARDGKLVIRPDSGDPVNILCGDPNATEDTLEFRGAVEILWEIFGGTVNSKGFKQLDSHIGLIYGDSITLERAERICARLRARGFASTNVVFGIGSYTYQYVTRDTLGFAMKATYGEVAGKALEIYKDPFTDGGVKKSAKGLLRVNEDLTLSECVTHQEEGGGLLKTVFLDSHALTDVTLSQIRDRIDASILITKGAREARGENG